MESGPRSLDPPSIIFLSKEGASLNKKKSGTAYKHALRSENLCSVSDGKYDGRPLLYM
jgi:hypothetical protein